MKIQAMIEEKESMAMNIIKKGKGELFTDSDPDYARTFFQKKSRKMVNKSMTLTKAIETFVHDGEYLALGGFGVNRTPVAACHEILRQGRKNMGFAGHITTHDFEILCAGEVFDRVDAGYIVGLEARGLSPCARRYMQTGKVKVTEWTNYSLSARLWAGAMGVIMETCSQGYVDYTFLGGAQIDMYGNLNSTYIGGTHQKPKVRLPGSGGANDFGSFCWKMMVLTVQDAKRFVEKCEFITTPGWLHGGNSRYEAGLPEGTGPYKVFTNMAVMDFEPESKRMRIISINPGYLIKDVQDNCGFELLKAPKITETAPPTEIELKILREEVDPHRYVIGR